ncbi:MAG TPA: hypothetical protein VHU18_14250 [Rhizomicrobium sp.]|jgi:hypothetical protein|nr:hypothetical protein [Rhizomicrobium sp.]
MFGKIEVDLEVHKAIEAERQSFTESANDILRRIFRLRKEGSTNGHQVPEPKQRSARRGGNYKLRIVSKETAHRSLKEVLRGALTGVESQQHGFLEKLAGHRTTRGRRIVARKADELYPGNPQLVENCAERLDSRWWFDTNVSLNQAKRYLRTISDISGIKDIELQTY